MKKFDVSERFDGRFNIWMLGPDPESEVGHDIIECWRWLLVDVADTRRDAIERVKKLESHPSS